jgi:hypothetical protein
MLYLLKDGQDKAQPLEPSSQGFTESELRTLIGCLPELLGEDLFVLNYEFGGFTPSGNRAGILAVSRQGKKFIVELRQGEADATELKALEYAASYSRATVADLADAYATGKVPHGKKVSSEAALAQLKQYLEEGEHTNGLDPDPAIVVFASDFRPEFYTTAMWLKERGVNISCVRFQGYHVDDSWVIDVDHDSPFVLGEEARPEVTRDEPVADPGLRYPLLRRVRQILVDGHPDLEVVSYPDALVFPTEQDNIYFAMSIHTYPEPFVEIGLRFERESLNYNRAVAKRLLDQMEAIEGAIGEPLDVQDPWYRSWVRLSVRRSYDPHATSQADEAAETVARFVDVLMPYLLKALELTPGVETSSAKSAVARPA